MDNTSWIDYKKQVRERLKVFALTILELSESLPNSERARILNQQVTRSGTSTYANNYRAGLRARSKAEFFAKLFLLSGKKIQIPLPTRRDRNDSPSQQHPSNLIICHSERNIMKRKNLFCTNIFTGHQ